MRAGVIAVPLDMRSTQDFAERVADKTQPGLAFVSRLTPPAHQELDVPKVYFEEMEELIREMPAPRDAEVADDDLAEIIFTSGTTGDPKGVMITHANLVTNLEGPVEHVPGKPSYRLISILPLSHMFEQMASLLSALHCGANITFPTSRQPTVLFRTMRERKVTTMLLVPQALDVITKRIEAEVSRRGEQKLWRFLLKIAARTPFRLRRLLFRGAHKQFGGSLELIVSGGAALDAELGAKWSALGVKVIQAYGATEASPTISCHTLKNPRFDSVGRPIPNVDVRISEEGEILVRGPNLTPGYWNEPEKTAASFEDDWYKTGDLGFMDKEGFLHLRGRKKDMIVLSSGENVFPEDIEALLSKHPITKDAVVVGLPKGSGVEVHAALLLEDPSAVSEVVSWANRQLAEHQQIRGSTAWPDEDFPRTHTLKVKKGVVVDTLQGHASASPTAVPASQETPGLESRGLEHLIAEVCAIPVEQVTRERALGLDLNLDSLGRVTLLSAVEEELGVYLDESLIDSGTTVGQLIEMVQSNSGVAVAMTFPQWGMSLWCRLIRGALQRALVFPMLRLTNRVRVRGLENLRDLPGTVFFVSNHCLFLDNGLIIKTMPAKVRRRLTIAAAAEPMRNPIWAVLNPLLGNAFPFSREGNVRASLMAMEGNVPIVPLRLHIHRLGRPSLITFLRRSDVEIRFGKSLSFPPGTPYTEVTRVIEEAVKAL